MHHKPITSARAKARSSGPHPRIELAFACTVVPRLLLALASVLAPVLALAAAPLAARAQEPAPARLTVRLFSSEVELQGPPRTEATLHVRRDGEPLWSSAPRRTDANGHLRLRHNLGGRVVFTDTAILGGEHLTLQLETGERATMTAAPLLVASDAAADRLFGSGPAGEALQLLLASRDGAPLLEQTIEPASDGNWALDLAGRIDLLPGMTGQVLHLDAAGHRTIAYYSVLLGQLDLGDDAMTGLGTLGERLQAELQGAPGEAAVLRAAHVQGYSPRSTPGEFRMSSLGTIEAGGLVTLSSRSALPGAEQQITLTIPALELSLDPGADVVRGRGPATGPLRLDLAGPAGERLSLPLAPDAEGRFEAELAGRADLARGWRVWLVHDPGTGLVLRRIALVPQLRVRLHTQELEGLAEPGRSFRARLLDAADEQLAEASARSRADGGFSMNFFTPLSPWYPVPIRPGMRLEVDLDGVGDPLRLPVPAITARTDPDAETVSGVAEPSAWLTVHPPTPDDDDPSQERGPPLRVRADVNGRFVADFAGIVDIEPPMYGELEMRSAAGHAFVREWHAAELELSLDSAALRGDAPFGSHVSATLRAADGRTLARGATELAAGSRRWSLGLEDPFGARVVPEPGDRVEAQVGDDLLALTAPPLRGAIHVAADRIVGRGPANGEVRLYGLLEDAILETSTDAQGIFEEDLAGRVDLLYNDDLLVETDAGRHRVRNRIVAPGLTLDLSAARLVGSVEPALDLAIELLGPQGGLRAGQAARTDAKGEFRADLRDAGGRPLRPEAGDLLRVTAAQALVHERLEMPVPELRILGDLGADLHGRATPGGRLSLALGELFPQRDRFASLWDEPQIEPDGSWRSGMLDGETVRPGSRVRARYLQPSGHVVESSRYRPMLNLQHGGASLCGLADVGSEVSARLLDLGGRPMAEARAEAGPDGRFTVQLRSEAGEAIETEAGMRAELRVGEEVLEVGLPPLDIDVDWQRGAVDGVGPASARYTVSVPGLGCFGDEGPGVRLDEEWGETEPDGSFTLEALRLAPETPGLEIAFFAPDGQRFYRQLFRSRGRVYVGSPRVTGRAHPLSPLRASLLDAAGATRASADGRAGSDGAFELLLRDTENALVESRPGERLLLEASGESSRIPLQTLALDPQPGLIVGVAPPGATVRLILDLRDERRVESHRQTDERGRFVFGPPMVPPRADWRFEDILRAEAILELADGHELAAEAEVAGAGGAGVVYLPAALRP